MKTDRKKKIMNCIAWLWFTGIFLFYLMRTRVGEGIIYLLRVLRRDPTRFYRYQIMLLRHDPGTFALQVVGYTAIIIFILNGLRLVFLLLRPDSSGEKMSDAGRMGQGTAGQRKESAARPVQREGEYSFRNKKEAEKRQSRPRRRWSAGKDGESEPVLSHTWKTGKERYMEQLEGFLRDGVVTKEEYYELRKRYEKLED